MSPVSDYAPDYAPPYGSPAPVPGAIPSPFDPIFPPEKERVDAPPPGPPKHEFEVEDRRYTDWPRRRAAIIDGIILSVTVWALDGVVHGHLSPLSLSLALVFRAGPLALACALVYFFVMEATTGRTVGKRMMHLRVVMRDGRPAGANAIAARTVLRLFDFLPGAWLFGGLTMLLTGARRQRLGDLAAGTIVRRDDRPIARAPHSPLVAIYPLLWIGAATVLIFQTSFFDLHYHVNGRVTSNAYMRQVNDICQRRVDREVALGSRKTPEETGALWAAQLGAIDSLPKPPPNARHDMHLVKGQIHGFLRAAGSAASKAVDTSDPHRIAVLQAKLTRRLSGLQTQFRKLGLPACAAGRYWLG